jgi:hypothetical protein
MYEIVQNDAFKQFKTRVQCTSESILDGSKGGSYIDCIGRYHKVSDFKIDNGGAIDLLYKHKINSDTFSIAVKFVDVSYSIEIEKRNRCYGKYRQHNYDFIGKQIDHNITRRGVQIFGVSIGDLMKHFYHNARDQKSVILIDDNPTENEKTVGLLKKSKAIDTSMCDTHDVLGLYVRKKHTAYLWENLKLGGFISKGEQDFAGFCKKIIYFSDSTIRDLSHCTKGKHIISDELISKLLNELSDKVIVGKLLKYFLYNEDPELDSTYGTVYFDKPASVPDILMSLYGKTSDNGYLDMYNKVMVNLNTHQQGELESKYKAIIFRSLASVPDEYPSFALRNVLLQQWTTGGYYDDLRRVRDHYIDYMISVKNPRYKHKSSVSDKTILVSQRLRYNKGGCTCCRDSSKGSEKHKHQELLEEVADAVGQLESEEFE